MSSKKTTFGEDITRLDEIVRLLEEGNCSLEDSIALYQEGVEVSKRCEQQLKTARLNIEQLTGEEEESQ